ncbi:hypothetical protein REPUB_Repub03eG0281400 [Reevesia pubescens]
MWQKMRKCIHIIKADVIVQVQELYRIYQSLAECYDHFTRELRKSLPSDCQTEVPGSGLDQNSPLITPDKKLAMCKANQQATSFSSGGGSSDHSLKEGTESSSFSSDSDSESFSFSVNINLSSPVAVDNGIVHHKIVELGKLKKSESVSVLAEDMLVQLESLQRDTKLRESDLELEKGKVLELQKQIVELEAHVSDSNSEVVRLMEELAVSREKIKVSEEEIAMFKHELGKNISDDTHHVLGQRIYSKRHSHVKSPTGHREEAGKETLLEARLKEWELHGRILEEKIRQFEAGKMEIKGLFDVQEIGLQGHISQLKAELAEKGVHVEALNKNLDRMKSKCDMLMAEKDGVIAKVNTLVAELSSRDLRIGQMKEHLQQLSREHLE